MKTIQILRCPKCGSDQIRHQVYKTSKKAEYVVEVKCLNCNRFTRHYSNEIIGAEYRVGHDWDIEEIVI